MGQHSFRWTIPGNILDVQEPIEAVIFDLDGTLFDHPRASRSGIAALVTSFGLASTPELEATWLAAEDRHFASWIAGECSWEEQRRRRVREFLPHLGATVPEFDDGVDRVFAHYLTGFEGAWSAYEDAAPALQAVRDAGLKVALLTNGKRDVQLVKLERIGLLHLVGEIFTADDLGAGKPNPITYLTVCRALGVHPSRAIYVGDNYAHDVEGAQAAGLRAIYLDREDVGPHTYEPRVSSLSAVLALCRD